LFTSAISGGDYSDHTIFVAPLLFAALLIPLLVVAMRQPWRE
jgi:hypothetical protein